MVMSAAASLLKEARRQASLTQAELAHRLGVSQAAVAKLERPGANPSVDTLDDALWATGHRLTLATAPVRRRARMRCLIRQATGSWHQPSGSAQLDRRQQEMRALYVEPGTGPVANLPESI